MISKFKLLALPLLISLLFVGCAQSPDTTSPTTTSPTGSTPTTSPTASPPTRTVTGPYGELKFALGTMGNETFFPPIATASRTGTILAPMYDYLFWTERNQLKPGIIEKWEISPDGESWTFFVRKGVKFHNGADLTAEDVKFTIEQYMAADAYFPDVRRMVERVDLVDTYTVKVKTQGKQPYLPYMTSVPSPSQGLVIPKEYIEQRGLPYFERNPVGTGSFKYSRLAGGDFVEFEAVSEHWRVVPAFKKFTVILMPEETTRVASVKTGVVDLVEVGMDSAYDLEVAGYKSAAVSISTPQVQFHGTYDPRGAKFPTADIRVRQALSLAINREELNQTMFRGKLDPPMPPYLSDIALDMDVDYWRNYCSKVYRYDLEEAKKLLKEAGYADGFRIKLYSFPMPGGPYLPKLAEVIQAYWARIGVTADIVPIEMAVYTSWRRQPAEGFVGQATMHRFTGAPFTSRNLSSGFQSGAVNNLVSNAFPELDQLIEASLSETNDSKRQDMIAKAIKIAVDTYTSAVVGQVPGMVSMGKNVQIDFPVPLPTSYVATYAYLAQHR